jgi:hypothetical protein
VGTSRPKSAAISPELFEGGFEVFDDFLGEHVRIGEVVGFFQGFVSEPEDVETGFVTVDSKIILSRALALGNSARIELFHEAFVAQLFHKAVVDKLSDEYFRRPSRYS